MQAVRVDGRRNLLRVAGLVALYAQWDTLESRPTWARLLLRSGLAERTVARWLQELRVRGWLAHLEHGSTPSTRPMSLAGLHGNRAALYGLRVPLTPQQALEQAGQRLAAEVDEILCNPAVTPAPPAMTSTIPETAAETAADLAAPAMVGDETGSPPWSLQDSSLAHVGGFSRASQPVDNSHSNTLTSTKPEMTALRAGSEETGRPDLSIMVPVSGFEMLAVAHWLGDQRPVLGRCSRKLLRHLCKPYWRAGWSGRDILHALDHRPSVFSQSSGVLLCPDHPVSPAQFIRSRLRAWRDPDGAILPGHWSQRIADTAAGRAARRRVIERHGRAGAHLLKAGERALSSQRIAEHGRSRRAQAQAQARLSARAATEPAPRRLPARAEQDRRRAKLVEQARTELARLADRTEPTDTRQAGTARPERASPTVCSPSRPEGEPAASSREVYDRALARARGEFGAGTPPRRRRWRTEPRS